MNSEAIRAPRNFYWPWARYIALVCSVGLLMLVLVGCASSKPDAPEAGTEVGYGAVDDENVTGAVSTVKSDDVKEANPNSLAEMLQGRVSGATVTVMPGGGLKVRVRNAPQSMMSGSEPLYVVDNMPMSTTNGVLYGVNPREVESITVLKDAASTAIYGSRGANGVILIKTKRGN